MCMKNLKLMVVIILVFLVSVVNSGESGLSTSLVKWNKIASIASSRKYISAFTAWCYSQYLQLDEAWLRSKLVPLLIIGDPVHCCECCLWRPKLAQLCLVNERRGSITEGGRWREKREEEDASTCNPTWAWIHDSSLLLASQLNDTWRLYSSCLLPSPCLTLCAHRLAFWTETPTIYPQ